MFYKCFRPLMPDLLELVHKSICKLQHMTSFLEILCQLCILLSFFSILVTLFYFQLYIWPRPLFCVSLEDAYACDKVTMKMRTEFIWHKFFACFNICHLMWKTTCWQVTWCNIILLILGYTTIPNEFLTWVNITVNEIYFLANYGYLFPINISLYN